MSSQRIWQPAAAACGIVCLALVVQASSGSGYRILKKFPIPTDEATWDYISVDEQGRRLFVCQENQVHVLHADTGQILGKIPELKGAHAAVLVPEFKRGFITNGVSATVTMFDLDTLKKLKEIPAGQLADAMVYDPFSKRLFSMNTVSRNSTAINAADGTVAANIDLDGKPEQAVADGAGHVFANLKDKVVVARIDTQKLAIDKRLPIPGCDRPTTIAMDTRNRRLFVGCRDLMMYVMDSDNGRVITQLPIGDNVDNTFFDPATSLIFASSEDGLLTVVRQDSPDSYRVVETLKTLPGSKTMALDLSTHRIFLPYGEMEKLPPVKQSKTGGKVDMSGVRRKVLANSFGVLVVGK